MGFFGNKKKRYVSSTVYNLAGDEDKRPNFLKATVIGAVIAGKDSLAQAIQDAYTTGPGTRLKRFNNWAENQGYNGLVGSDEGVKKAWADVQADYQRRADMIPSIVATVKNAAKNEKDILTNVTNARAGISNLEKEAVENKDAISNAKTPADLDAVGQKINTAIKISVEAYPSIRSTDAFIGLQRCMNEFNNK